MTSFSPGCCLQVLQGNVKRARWGWSPPCKGVGPYKNKGYVTWSKWLNDWNNHPRTVPELSQNHRLNMAYIYRAVRQNKPRAYVLCVTNPFSNQRRRHCFLKYPGAKKIWPILSNNRNTSISIDWVLLSILHAVVCWICSSLNLFHDESGTSNSRNESMFVHLQHSSRL